MAQRNTFTSISASTLIATGEGVLTDIFIASHTSGTFKVWDALSAAGTVIINTCTIPAVGWYNLGNKHFTTGCYVDLGAIVTATVGIKEAD